MVQTTGITNEDDQEHMILSNNDDGEEEEDYNYRNFQRVTSRVQSNKDGSAEAILADVIPLSMSRHKSATISQNDNISSSISSTHLSNSLPLIRTNSTPNTTQIKHGAAGGGGGNTMISGGNNHSEIPSSSSRQKNNTGIKSPSRKMAYAMRKVFSREEKDDWREGEAEELVVHHRRHCLTEDDLMDDCDYYTRNDDDIDDDDDDDDSLLDSGRMSHVVDSHMQYHDAGEEEEGAEIVLEESEIQHVDNTIDNRNAITAKRYRNSATEPKLALTVSGKANTTKRYNKNSGYKLRRFLSTPNSKNSSQTASGIAIAAQSLRRTPSYEPDGYNRYDRAELYDDDDGDYERESPLYNSYNDDNNDDDSPSLSSPVGLKRTLSLRRKKSSSFNKTQIKIHHGKKSTTDMEGDDEDLSTVAESINSSSWSSDDGKHKRRRFMLRRIVAITFLLVLGVVGVAVYMILNNQQLEEGTMDASANSFLDDIGVSLGGDSYDVQAVIEDENADDDVDDDYVVVGSEMWTADGGAFSSRGSEDGASMTNEEMQTENPFDPDPPSPAMALPTSTTSETTDNAIITTSSPTTFNPSTEPTHEPSNKHYHEPTDQPSNKPTNEPTTSPTLDTYTKFYVMADCPYDDNERTNLMPRHISELSTDADFLFHLGDLQYAKVDDCQEYAYREASAILKKSPIPTFVLPGDNDINDCDDHEHGEYMWKKYFHKPDEQWEEGPPKHKLDVTRWGVLDESFSFLHKGVLYFGLNIVGGRPYSDREKRKRHKEHLEYIRWVLYENMDEDDFRVMVLLGHADPSHYHKDFFEGSDGFAAIVEDVGKPTVHFHGDSHEWYEVEGGGFELDNYMRISLDGESVAPPIQVEVDVRRKNPVRVSRRRSDLDVNCCKYGWPRHDEL